MIINCHQIHSTIMSFIKIAANVNENIKLENMTTLTTVILPSGLCLNYLNTVTATTLGESNRTKQ